MKVFIRIAFCGTAFYGTQKLPGNETIQGLFENLLSRIYDHPVKVTISSRLDRGVHALDFGMSFDIDSDSIGTEHLQYYLRRSVGKDVLIKSVCYAKDDFSPRYSMNSKTYLYLIQNEKNYNPLLIPYTCVPKEPLDVTKAREALFLFVGKHDFRFFSSPEGDENTILEIEDALLSEKDGLLQIRFVGKAFLRYQVRFMVGAILSHCQGRMSLMEIKSALEGSKCTHFKYKAEPQGLILQSIDYPDFPDSSPIRFL